MTKSPRSRSAPHRVAVVVYDGLCSFEFGIAVEVFGSDRRELGGHYRMELAPADAPPLRTSVGLEFTATGSLRALSRADTIVIPGWRDVTEAPPSALLRALRRAEARGARLVSLCSGAFVLAAAGLLDGRRATTHWRYADPLAAAFPAVHLDPDVLYVEDRNVFTAAGSAAGLDLALHLVRNDLGAKVAADLARRLVVPPHRDGGQAQFIGAVAPEGESALAGLLDELRTRLHEPHTAESLARRLHVSPRTLARRFDEALGTTPHRWLTRERVLRAQALLEASDAPVEEIAHRCGFAEAQALRIHFRRQVGTSPSAYRTAFRGKARPSA